MTRLSKLTKEYLIKRYSALTMQYRKSKKVIKSFKLTKTEILQVIKEREKLDMFQCLKRFNEIYTFKKSNYYHILEIDYFLLQYYDIYIQQRIKDKIIEYLQQQKQYKDYTRENLENAVNYGTLVSQFRHLK